jgi:hypothetical protein
MNEEADESETIKPLIEFKIEDGKVEMYEPGEILAIPSFGDEDMRKRFNDPHGERGCSLETVTKAFNFVEEKFKILNSIEKGKFWKEIQNK